MEEGCVDHDDRIRVRVDVFIDKLINPGVNNGLVMGEEGRIGKEETPQGPAVDTAPNRDEGYPPCLRNGPKFRENSRSYVAQGLMGDYVGIEDEKTLARKDLPCRVFSRAHWASQADNRSVFGTVARLDAHQWNSPQLCPDSTLTRRGTASSMTASISRCTSSLTFAVSATGDSRINSS